MIKSLETLGYGSEGLGLEEPLGIGRLKKLSVNLAVKRYLFRIRKG